MNSSSSGEKLEPVEQFSSFNEHIYDYMDTYTYVLRFQYSNEKLNLSLTNLAKDFILFSCILISKLFGYTDISLPDALFVPTALAEILTFSYNHFIPKGFLFVIFF